ncbi:hypothetical protein BYT27DRAFT_7222938 [Phlegmacium glaucopus]|nr:hypothetical protein BYT27DRAFT_7222938 [Phlegmacium glaucopus]
MRTIHKLKVLGRESSNIFFETNDNPSIEDLTHDAFSILGEEGGMRLSDRHTCSDWVADFLPVANDPAAVLAMVKMIIMDVIVMGPTHCAFDNCTRALLNACGQGESFFHVHTTEFQNHCHVCDYENNRVDGTQACQEHCNDWHQYRQS